jgi:hypothetical protein
MADAPDPSPNVQVTITPQQIKEIEDVAVGIWPTLKAWLPTILVILSSLGVGAGGIVGYQSMRADPAPAPTPAPVPPKPDPAPPVPVPAVEPFIKLKATSILANAGEPVWIEAETNAAKIHWFGPEGIQFRSFRSENLAFVFAPKETKSGQYRVRGFVGTDKSGLPIEQTCVVSIVGVDPAPSPPTPTPVPVPVPPSPVPVTPTIKAERLSSNPGMPLTVSWSGGTTIEGTDKIILAGLLDGKEVVWRFAGAQAGSHTFGLGHVSPGLYEWRLVSPAGVRLASTLFQVVGQMPLPPPVPPTPVPPTPTPPVPPPSPAPIPLAGFRVLIVYDPATLTLDQSGIVYGKAVRDYLQAKCVVGADGKTKDFWILQSGVDVSAAPKWIGDVIQRHPGQKTFMVVSDGKTGFDGDLPANAVDAMAIFTKIGGPQ